MCKFFSAISNGKGEVKFFKPEDIAKVMSEGNKKSYEWNSHTSIAHFFGIEAEQEDKWNKWEYDTTKKELSVDSLNTTNDSDLVKTAIEEFLKDKDLLFMQNLYNYNSGNRNSGNCNSGNCNSGNRNSGDYNSGNRNSGDYNSGNYNSGNYNSGDCNSGNRNSGNCNSGNYNSGDCNSGNYNSGDCNSGTTMGSFCTKKQFFLFDKKCTEAEFNKVYDLGLFNYLEVSKFIWSDNMTEEEKTAHPEHKIIGGYLKKLDYKEAWKNVPKEKIEQIKKLKNFNKKVFKEITGLEV